MRYVIIFASLALSAGAALSEPCRTVEWSWGPVLPTAQTACGSAANGAKIVVVGGTYWVDSPNGAPVKVFSNKVWALDSNAMKWTALADYPIPIAYSFVVADGHDIWVIGGSDGCKLRSETYVLDVSQVDAKWESGPTLPIARMGSKGGIVDGAIYVAAGSSQSGSKSKPATDVLRLDTGRLAEAWEHVTDVPERPVEWRFGTIVGGTLYLFGGLVAEDPTDKDAEFEVRTFSNEATYVPQSKSFAFDIAAKQWRVLSPLPVPMGSGGCSKFDDDHILITGGLALALEKKSQSDRRIRSYFSNECFIYDIQNDHYESLTPGLRLAVLDHGSAYIDHVVYVIGGEESPWKSRTDMVQVGRLVGMEPIAAVPSMQRSP